MSQRRWIASLAMLGVWSAVARAGEESTTPEINTLDAATVMEYLERSSITFEIGPVPDKRVEIEPFPRCDRRALGLQVIQAADGSKVLTAQKLEGAKRRLLEQAERHFQAKRYAQALESYTRLLEQNPNDSGLWVVFGDAHFGLKDYKSALDCYRHAIDLDQSDPFAHAFAADALLHLDRPAEAREHWLKALSLDPTYDQASSAVVPKLASAFGVRLERISIDPPEVIGKRRENVVPVMISLEQIKPWGTYVFCKALWRHDESFRRDRGDSSPYQPDATSFREESECLKAMLLSRLGQLPDSDLEQLDATSARILEALKAGVWDGMVLWEVFGRRCPGSLSLLEEQSHRAIEQYLETMVIRPLK